MTAVQHSAVQESAVQEVSPVDLVAKARELAPLLAKNAAQGERDRRVAEESIRALTDAGLFKIAVPRRYGGHETSMRTMLDVSATIADGADIDRVAAVGLPRPSGSGATAPK